jgi:ArsR family transcriptional regulator, arsenate/arsenite/antimonite-responsive transcriptional repressor / arsenate reductase (thioredoxin)
MNAASTSAPPAPVVFRLAAHTLRWRLLTELARSDCRVRELTGSLGEPQPLVSYHLRQLRTAGLVSARRSSFDGRDSYYSLDLARCGELLGEAGAALHPGLRLEAVPEAERRRSRRAPRVLFLCTGNSARSQIAEALLHDLSGGSVRAFSAGSRPKELHPNAIRVMRERGIDVSKRRSKHLDTLRRRHFDWVISLCDRVREVCPEFPGEPRTIHWSIPDPAAEPGGNAETYPAFERTAAELETRIRYLLSSIGAHTNEEVSHP